MARPAINNTYLAIYFLLILCELFFIFLAWSPYGAPNGKFRPLYLFVRTNLTSFMVFAIIALFFFSLFFPGVGFFALLIILYRVAEMCCGTRENFGDGFRYGFGYYSPDRATVYDQGKLEREMNGSQAGDSSAQGDSIDPYWQARLAQFENGIVKLTPENLKRKVLVFPKDSCGYGNWIIPKIRLAKKGRVTSGGSNCDYGCSPCSLAFEGSVFEQMWRPRPLYTTSTIAKKLGEK